MPIKIPKAMEAELQRWNGGEGVSVEAWVGCVGNFNLAIGYSTVFWPRFELIEGYILTEGWTAEFLQSIKNRPDSSPRAVEWMINHRHILDIHAGGDVAPTVEHIVRLGTVLKEIY